MAQVLTFPKDLEYHLLTDADKGFLFTWLFLFIVGFTLSYWGSLQPIQIISKEDIKKYQEVIYRVKATPPKKVEKIVEEVATTEEVEEEPEEVVEEVVVEKPKTEEVKKEVREEKRKKRKDRQEKRREKIREAAKHMAIVGGPTARGGRSRAGGASAREALGLSKGGLKGVDASKMAGLVSSGESADKIKKMRGGGEITDEVGELDISELKALSADDLQLMLKEATIKINKSAITAKGRGSKSKKRSPSAISGIVLQNKNQVQACYWTVKRRDSSLKGRVVVEFTISPAGDVIRVRFRKKDWGGNRLGVEVERCIKNIISSWHFDPIGEKDGNVTAGATYTFE
jgi:outer membrane biosynthesis protein TonB